VSGTLQLEEARSVEVQPEPPRLQVEWTSRWQEFVTAIGPAMGRSEARLAGEAPFGLVPFRIMIPSYVLEAFLIFAAIIIPVKLQQLRPYVAPRISSHDVIYYSGDELPRTEDLGGAQAGTTGRAGGDEAHHRTQTIRIARGGSLVPRVVDAPNLKLPSSRDAVANLLAVKPNPGPPPLEGLRSARSAPNLPTTIIAPAPNVIRDYTRNGVSLDGVIAPAPSVQRDHTLTAPNFSATVVPPAPEVSRDHPLVAPAMAPAVIPPAPSVSRDHTMVAPSLNASVVAPAPSVSRDSRRTVPTMATNIIPPAPSSVSREISRAPVQMANAAVVPPPVSAPPRTQRRDPMLSLPAPSVVAPPPSADVSRDLHRLASGNAPDPSKTVVPPPPQTGSGSVLSSLIGKIFGASEVVPPPPTVNTNGSTGGTASTSSLPANVVPPPPSVAASAPGASPRGNRSGMGASVGSNVIAPPPTAGVTGGTGTRSAAASTAMTVGLATVVAPPPALTGAGGGTGHTAGGNGTPTGTLMANNVVPPPPSVGGGSGAAGSGLGRKGAGLGSPMEAGSPVAPPPAGGSGTNAGTVISSQPGAKVGLPPAAASGSLSLSPSGGEKSGLGGAGGGASIGHGADTGSGVKGAGPGAGKTGAERGSDPNAHAGISPTPGPGGAGTATNGTPPVPGVSVSGGNTVVNLGSFGDDPAADPKLPARSSAKAQPQTLGVTIVATANSGGAFEPYKNQLRGEKYTTYVDTSMGTVVMEFADESSAGHPYGATLAGPVSVSTTLPENLPRARIVLKCTLDAAGNLKNVRVLEPGPADVTAKIVAALRAWKFQPAMRGNEAVEVTAILGFNIDTNDRF
jgi:TonB family protein